MNHPRWPVPGPVGPGAGDWTLLYADARALPALATAVAALPAGRRALAYVQVADPSDVQPPPPRTSRRPGNAWRPAERERGPSRGSGRDAVRVAIRCPGSPSAAGRGPRRSPRRGLRPPRSDGCTPPG
ncbi:SIP domain-containing protein [Streptomyces sp. NPDC059352]|uniref:SIP domain-containing protein n=1 Tax=Streptomyces sp. NPDC059352 TaxID=3346810 RepID=UPI0036951723